jgi:hypothetical protein
MYQGHDWDVIRWCNQSAMPMQDRAGLTNWNTFGGPHSSGFMSVFCDGSVHLISYSIDLDTHTRLGNRRDGLVVDATKY